MFGPKVFSKRASDPTDSDFVPIDFASNFLKSKWMDQHTYLL